MEHTDFPWDGSAKAMGPTEEGEHFDTEVGSALVVVNPQCTHQGLTAGVLTLPDRLWFPRTRQGLTFRPGFQRSNQKFDERA